GWPKVVSAETEEKLENGAVELMTIAWVVSILLVNPVGESWLFIVQEDTTVLNRGSTLGADGVDGVDVLVGLWWDVGPVVPWRDTDLLRNVVETVDGATLVCTGNNKSPGDTLNWVLDDLGLESLPFSL